MDLGLSDKRALVSGGATDCNDPEGRSIGSIFAPGKAAPYPERLKRA